MTRPNVVTISPEESVYEAARKWCSTVDGLPCGPQYFGGEEKKAVEGLRLGRVTKTNITKILLN